MSYTPQGLVTVAFLKTQLDAGQDHLSLFEPLVLDALNQIKLVDLVAGDVREIISERTNLAIPIDTVQTLLGRFARGGYLVRSGDRFHKTDKVIPASNLASASAAIKADLMTLGEALLEYSIAAGIAFDSPESALQNLAGFISMHKLEILLQHSPSDPKSGDLKDARNLARFITERCIPEPGLNRSLTALLEGILLADVLLMKDIHSSQLKFSHSQVFLDTRILLAALGLNGSADEIATKEGIEAIRNAGAQLGAFERTIVEMRGILHVYEDRLGSNRGRLSLFPTSMTSHMIAKRYTPTDVQIIALEIEQRLKRMAISIHEFPEHVPAYTLDEQALVQALSKSGESDEEIRPRVLHDVDCVAAVLTLRAGQVSYDLERTRALFSTTAGMIVKNVQQWYSDQRGKGLSPVVHHAYLTTLAWLKKPASSPNLKLHELAATCLSAIRPTDAVWDKMISTLRQYVEEGRMSDDESVAIVANGLTETLLSRLDDDFNPDSGSINETIERVRDELRREHLSAASAEIERVRTESEEKLEAARAREEAAKEEAIQAQQAAADARARANQALTATEGFISQVAHVAGRLVYWVIVVGLFIGAGLSMISVAHSKHPVLQSIITSALALGIILSFLGSAWGISAKSLGERIERWVAGLLRRRVV